MNATLQEYFQCMIDSNVYIGSKNSDGISPRYDNSEIFILQIEGQKNWRVYKPPHRSHILSRESKSADPIGEPVLDVVLKAGDLLYFPRGYIYEATTAADSHSLHMHLSLYKKQVNEFCLQFQIEVA